MNRKIKQRAKGIIDTIKGMYERIKSNSVTVSDWKLFAERYKSTYGRTFEEDLRDAPDEGEEQVQLDAISDEARQMIEGAFKAFDEQISNGTRGELPNDSSQIVLEAANALRSAASTIAALQREPENDAPEIIQGSVSVNTQTMAKVLGHSAHTPTHLFGIEHKFFATNKWWNEIAVTGKAKEDLTKPEKDEFLSEFNEFSGEFKQRVIQLSANNQISLLNFGKMIKGESYIDYSTIDSKLGEYTIRRFDMIIAYLRQFRSVAGIFPLVSNVQNKMEAPTAIFDELSQSFLGGYHYKGGVSFDAEVYKVDDVMMKFLFEDPKDLEKSYLGYMNREGSNPMKWNMFEWCIVHFGTILFNEQQRRRVIGCWVPRQGDFPQPAMRASDGALRAIERVEEELKVLPFKDLKIYTESTILDYMRTFWDKVNMILPNMEGMRLFANEKHRQWYIDAYDEKYGKNTDYRGPENSLRYTSPEQIIWVPNMGNNDYKMWITPVGNVENYENRPNEMYAFYFEQNLENLLMASWWKEGSGVLAPGAKFSSVTDLEKSGRIYQRLFTNYPVTTLEDGATTVDGSENTVFETGSNTAETKITDIVNASPERVYKIICGNTTNATKIDKTGNFASIKEAWTPNAVGDYIKVYCELKEEETLVGSKTIKRVVPSGKFLELERKVTA